MMRRGFLAFAFALLPLCANASGFSFALIGDVPYSDLERRQLPDLLDRINADPDVAFIVHDGDIKDGASLCSDDLFRDRLALFDSSLRPFVLVPGDNDWTDCSRKSNGRHDPLERLDTLRALFFDGDAALGREKLHVERQSSDPRFPEFRENLRWRRGGVVFVTLNVPGGGNRYSTRSGRVGEEFRRRNAANLAWLGQAFTVARKEGLPGLVIVMQANPGFEAEAAGHAKPGYRDLLCKLRAGTSTYAGQVLFVHGDTHMHRIDKPLLDRRNGRPLANFTRVETFGSPFMGWVKVTVQASGRELFRLQAFPYVPPSPAY